MQSNYTIVLRDNRGNQPETISPITKWISLEYVKTENEIGSLYLDLPPIYPISAFQIDGQIEIWRSVGMLEPYLELDTAWLIRLVRYKTDDRGNTYIHILAHDAIEILDRRIVAYQNQTSYTTKTAPCDDMIKVIVRENFGDLATDTTRDISDWLLVDSYFSQCPTIDVSEISYRKVFPLLQEWAEISTQKGIYLSFDVVREKGTGIFRLKTFPFWRGKNMGLGSGAPLVVSVKNGLLSYGSITLDHTEEYTCVYAGGQGKTNNRLIAYAYDAARWHISPLNLREDFIASSNYGPDEALIECQTRLNETRPKIGFNGHIQQNDKALYGVDFNFGDVIVASYQDITMDVHLDSVHVRVNEDGSEEIDIFSRNLSDTEY